MCRLAGLFWKSANGICCPDRCMKFDGRSEALHIIGLQIAPGRNERFEIIIFRGRADQAADFADQPGRAFLEQHPSSAARPLPLGLLDALPQISQEHASPESPGLFSSHLSLRLRSTQILVRQALGHIAKRLRTEISSSTSSQGMPTPEPIRRQFAR